jgi:hypothetical protein
MVNTPFWECSICKNLYTHQESAEKCESQGEPLEILPKGTVFFNPTFEQYDNYPEKKFIIIKKSFTLTRINHDVVYNISSVYRNPFPNLIKRGYKESPDFYREDWPLLGFDGKRLRWANGNPHFQQGFELKELYGTSELTNSKYNFQILSQEEIKEAASNIGLLEQVLDELSSSNDSDNLDIGSLSELSDSFLIPINLKLNSRVPIFDKFR